MLRHKILWDSFFAIYSHDKIGTRNYQAASANKLGATPIHSKRFPRRIFKMVMK